MSDKDFWGRHHIGLRFMSVGITVCFIVLVIAAAQGIPVSNEIFYVVAGTNAYIYAAISFGKEGITKILETIVLIIKGK